MNKNLKITICSFIILSFLGFGSYLYLSQNNANNNKNASLGQIVISNDYPVTSKLEEMIDESDYIVVGHYSDFDTSWNMARNPEDITQEDTENYVEGRLYNFNVDRVLKGSEVNDTIKVNHRYLEKITFINSDEVTNSQGIIEEEATFTDEHSFDKKDFLFIEPELNAKYILFLKKDINMDNYYGSIEPFSIKFNSNDIAELQSNLINSNRQKDLTSKITLEKDLSINIVDEIDSEIKDSISNKTFEEILSEIENQVNQ